MQQVIEGFRLSPQQTRLWLKQQDSNAYHAQCAILIEGKLNKELLNNALTEVINRHEVLRTTYHQVPVLKVPVQVIGDLARFYPPVEIDLRHVAEADQEARLKAFLLSERQRAFDLENGPLLNLHLIVHTDRRHRLIVDLPTLCADSASLINLVREISSSYDALLRGHTISAEPLQYAQFAEWQLEMISNREPVMPISVPTEIHLPFEVKPEVESSFEPSVVAINFEEHLGERRGSLNSFFLGCWLTFLYRTTGLPDISVPYLRDGRQFEELQSTFGLCAEAVPIKVDVDSDTAFSEIQYRAQEAIDGTNDRQGDENNDLPVVYEFEDRPARFGGSGLRFSITDLYCCAHRFKIKLVCILENENVRCELHYNSAIFSEETVSDFIGIFKQIVHDALTNPLRLVGDIDLLNPDERRRVLKTLAGSRSAYPRESCLHHLIEHQVELNPQSIAVDFGVRQLTYRELNARANQLANYLRSCGVGPEVRVGICLERSAEMMIAVLGVLKGGGAYVPMDPADPEDRLGHILSDSQVKILLTQKKVVDRLPAGSAKIICIDEEIVGPGDEENPDTSVTPDNLAYVIYTSGSTGKPKGTLITHRGAVNYLWWASDYYQVKDGDGSVVFSPITFDMVVTTLFAPLLNGRRVRLSTEASSIDGLAESLKADCGMSFVKMTPAHLELLAQASAGERVSDWSRAFILGGEALMAESLSFWRENAPRTRIFNEYGPTETVVGCCVYEVLEQTPATGAVSIGSPTANTQLYVLNQRMRLSPRGVDRKSTRLNSSH